MTPTTTRLHFTLLFSFAFLLLPLFPHAQYDNLAIGQTAGADVHHVTNPWYLQQNVPYNPQPIDQAQNLDINGDGTYDVSFYLKVFGVEPDSQFVAVRSRNGSEFVAQSASYYADTLLFNDTLRASSNWLGTTGSDSLPLYELRRGNLSSGIDIASGWQYLGVRFDVNGVWMYAWLKWRTWGYSTHWSFVEVHEYGWKGDAGAVGLEEESLLDQVRLFPNPGRGLFHLQLPADLSGAIGIQIFDVKGKKVGEMNAEAISSSGIQELDLQGLPAGLYHLRLRSDDHQVMKKFVKL